MEIYHRIQISSMSEHTNVGLQLDRRANPDLRELFICMMQIAYLPLVKECHSGVIGSTFKGIPGSLVAMAGGILVPFTLLMVLGLICFQVSAISQMNRLLAGFAAGGM